MWSNEGQGSYHPGHTGWPQRVKYHLSTKNLKHYGSKQRFAMLSPSHTGVRTLSGPSKDCLLVINQWSKSLWCIFYSSQRWVHDDQWWVQDWSGVSPWSSLTSPWRSQTDREWSGLEGIVCSSYLFYISLKIGSRILLLMHSHRPHKGTYICIFDIIMQLST